MRWIAAFALAASAVTVALTRVAVDFRPARARLVTEATLPASDNTIVRTIPPSPRPLSVVIARITLPANADPASARAEISENGRVLGLLALAAGRNTRLDIQVPSGLSPGGLLRVACNSPGWSLTALEVANLHGFSSGIINAFFVPASRRDYQAIAWWLAVLVGAALFALWLPPRALVERIGLGLGLLLFALALAAPLVSDYGVVLAVPTFILALVLLYAGSLARRYSALRLRLAGRSSSAAFTLDAVASVVLVTVFYVASALHGVALYNGNYHGFLHVSDRWAPAPVLDPYPDVRRALMAQPFGYDGQFMFMMAFDPLLTRLEPVSRYREVVDSPPYRYGRIGFSLLTRLASGGDPRLFAKAMVWLVVAGHVLAAAFLVAIARQRGASAFAILPYVLIPGFLVSLGNALPESIAAAFLLGGLWSYRRWLPAAAGTSEREVTRRGRWLAAAIVFWGASLLVRETGLLLIAVVIAWNWGAGDEALARGARRLRARAALRLLPLLAVLPAVAWRLYVGWRLAPDFGWRAFWNDPQDLTLPLAGFVHLWSVNDAAHGHGQPFTVWFPVLLVALLALAVFVLRARRNAVAIAGVGYALLAISLNYRQIWTWAGNGERGTYEAFLVVLIAALPFATLPRALRWACAAFAVALFVYDFQYATSASWFRAGLVAFR